MAYTSAWLEDPLAVRSLFVEIVIKKWSGAAWVAETLYLSTAGYITADAATSFIPIIEGPVSLNETLSLEGGISFSFGEIRISNTTGDYDTWLDPSLYIWANGTIQIYLGDPFWNTTSITTLKSEFLQVFNGVIEDIDSSSVNFVNIKLRDKMQKLNVPLTESKVGTQGTWAGGQSNQDSILPLVFGEVFNFEPTLVDPSTLKYVFCDGAAESLIEVRDNGVPIYTAGVLTTGATVTLGNPSYFTLTKPPAGSISVSVQGLKRDINLSTGAETATYANTIPKLIALIVMKYGNTNSRLNWSEIDSTTFSAAAYAKAVGVLISDRENVLNVCQALANSIGLQLYFDRAGKLKLLRVGDYVGTPKTITDSDILRHSLQISNRHTPVSAGTKIGYCKNYFIQQNLLTGIPDEHKTSFGEEWYSKSYTNSTSATNYKISSDPEQKDTFLITATDALAEATRLNAQQSVVRTTYKFIGTSTLLSLELGQQVALVHTRFNLYNSGNGTIGQVISLAPKWQEGTIEVEVLV